MLEETKSRTLDLQERMKVEDIDFAVFTDESPMNRPLFTGEPEARMLG